MCSWVNQFDTCTMQMITMPEAANCVRLKFWKNACFTWGDRASYVLSPSVLSSMKTIMPVKAHEIAKTI